MNHTRIPRSRRPFRSTPDTEAYFPSSTHEAALTALKSAFADREAVALVDGDSGTGKTLIGLRFLESLPNAVPRVLIPSSRFSRPADLFQAMLFDFDAPYQGLTEHELRLAITERLLTEFAGGWPTVVVLDEAQHLGADLLEEIRLLGNLGTRSSKAAFVVLLTMPTLRERLIRPESASLAQRLAVRCHIEPLTSEESVAYLVHQLSASGMDAEDVLSEEASVILAAQCRGVPRLLNQAASVAFSLTTTAGEQTVDVEAVLEALSQLGLAEPTVEEPAVLPHPAKPVHEAESREKTANSLAPSAEPRTGKARGPKRRSA